MRCMKPDHRTLFITSLGVFQVVFGSLFLTIGGWALVKSRSSLDRTIYCPFWLTFLCFFNGFLSIVAPRQTSKVWLYSLIQISVLTCFVSTALSGWMLSQMLTYKGRFELVYASLVMGLCVILLLATGITAGIAWTAKNTGLQPSRRNPMNSSGTYLDPPPAYYPNQVMYFDNENFRSCPPVTERGAPPPYAP